MLRTIARAIVPTQLRRVLRGVPVVLDAYRLGSSASGGAVAPERAWELLQEHPSFAAQQKRSEIVRALHQFAAERPKRVLEIGAAGGGTSFLLSRIAEPTSTIVSLDLKLPGALALAMRAWGRSGQRTIGLRRDSHAAETVRAVANIMNGKLDLLFIDGDHSYDGVRTDFLLYSPLVRGGGLIAFHDIVPDNAARGRHKSLAWSGGVPRFWSEIREELDGNEFVEDPEQDGYGIGVVTWPGGRETSGRSWSGAVSEEREF